MTTDAAAVPAAERRVATPHGRVFVRETPGQDPPVVLLHGYPDDHRIYDRLLPLLTPRRAVAFDWLGYGRSDRSATAGYRPEEHAGEIEAVLDALGIGRAVVVGHDLSGPDAVAFAVARPHRVARLVLLNTVLGHQPSLRMPEMTRLFADPALAALADAMVDDEGQRLWLLQYTAARWGMSAEDPAMQAVLPQFFGDADQPHALTAVRAWAATVFDAFDRQDALIDNGVLRALEVPVSVIFGENDPYLNPALAAEIAGVFKDASLHLVPDAAHYPQLDRPEVVARLLTEPADA